MAEERGEDSMGMGAKDPSSTSVSASEQGGASSSSDGTHPQQHPLRPGGFGALKEALVLWAVAFAAIVVCRAIGPVSAYAKAVAALAFIYLPGLVVWRRHEDYADYGAASGNFATLWGHVKLGLLASSIILPLFALGFAAFAWALPAIPESLRSLLGPYGAPVPASLRFPAPFWMYVLDQLFVVALPEEFFYRGYLQRRLNDAWPSSKGRFTLWGVSLGPGFWLTAALFALGHLAIFQPWRLAVFFPALAFGWLREKSGSIVPGIILHALANLTLFVLEASFFGLRGG